MPTEDWGQYEQGLTVGTQVSSTYEGRHITATAAELNHGNILGVVTKGYPVIFGINAATAHGVGVAFNTEVTGADLIAVDTEGIWNLTVTATDDAAGAGGVVRAGDPLYINTATAIISKIRNLVTQIPFGYALGGLAQDVSAVIAVKVHWDPRQEQDEFAIFLDGHGADDAESITVQDNTTHTGSVNAFHALMTKMTGAITGAGAISAINGDVQARANCSHVYAFKGYTGISGTPTLQYMTGFYVYCDDLGGATVAHYQCADLNIASNNPATAGNSFIRMGAHGAAANAALYFPLATGVTNLIWFEQMVQPLNVYSAAGTAIYSVACYVGAFGAGTTLYLRLYDTI